MHIIIKNIKKKVVYGKINIAPPQLNFNWRGRAVILLHHHEIEEVGLFFDCISINL